MASSLNFLSRSKRSRGFTLVEVLIAASLGSFILAGTLTAFLMLVRSGVRISNYSMMESQTRRAFEQLGIDARMSNNFARNPSGSVVTYFTLTIPNNSLTAQTQVTYGYETDPEDTTKLRLFRVPGNNVAATVGRQILVNRVSAVTFLRYDAAGSPIPGSTISDAGLKHVQISISVTRSDIGVAAATQVIRSSAFTLRNISI